MEKKLTQNQISNFCSSISLMLHSGTTILDACELFTEDSDPACARMAKAISSAMEQGESFSRAAEASGAFPEYALNVFETAEYTGCLEEALEQLSSYYERQEGLMLRLRNTVLYPLVLLLLMCLVLAVLVFTVLPMFQNVFNSLTGSLAASSYSYVKLSVIIGKVSFALAALVAAAMLYVVLRMRSPAGQEKMIARAQTFAFTEKAFSMLAVSQLSDTLATLIASGSDPETTMQRCLELTSHHRLHAKLERCLERMQTGESISESLCHEEVFPPLYGRILLNGSRGGNLETVLEDISDRLGRSAENALAELLDTIEPVLIGFLTAAVGMTLLSVMLPLLGILGAL